VGCYHDMSLYKGTSYIQCCTTDCFHLAFVYRRSHHLATQSSPCPMRLTVTFL
jgi:hypothetical protein